MHALLTEYGEHARDAITLLFFAYLSLLVTWPAFLLLERRMPVQKHIPRANYRLNWLITGSNLLLAPAFVALAVLGTTHLVSLTGLPRLELSTAEIGIGIPAIDLVLQATVIFFTACFLGDFWYYWWHRAQHKIPFLWELHKLHHSDEHLNTTTIFRSHFLEPAGQALVKGLVIGLVFDTTEAPQTLLAIIAGALLPGLWDYFIHANVRIDALHRLLPFFSVPQFHWIHHSRMPEHQDRNFSIWLPLFDIAFGSYYRPRVDEYPPTGLSSGEKINGLWAAQAGPLVAWAGMYKRRDRAPATERAG